MHTKSVVYYKVQQIYAVSSKIQARVHSCSLNQLLHFLTSQICNHLRENSSASCLL